MSRNYLCKRIKNRYETVEVYGVRIFLDHLLREDGLAIMGRGVKLRIRREGFSAENGLQGLRREAIFDHGFLNSLLERSWHNIEIGSHVIIGCVPLYVLLRYVLDNVAHFGLSVIVVEKNDYWMCQARSLEFPDVLKIILNEVLQISGTPMKF